MGPMTDPWGMPHDKAAVSETNLPTETDKDLSVRQEEHHSKAVPENQTPCAIPVFEQVAFQ